MHTFSPRIFICLVHKHIRAHKHTKKEVDEEECFSKLTGRRLIHPSQPVTPIPSLLLFLLPASLFSIKCQDWPFYNHICDLGSGIQMQSMSIRITRLLIERGEMVWAISPILILTLYLTYILHIMPKLGFTYIVCTWCLCFIGSHLSCMNSKIIIWKGGEQPEYCQIIHDPSLPRYTLTGHFISYNFLVVGWSPFWLQN